MQTIYLVSLRNYFTYLFDKGQLISKGLYGNPQFFQKTNEKNSTWGIVVLLGRIFSFVFWKNWRHQNVLLKSTDLYYHGIIGINQGEVKKKFSVGFTTHSLPVKIEWMSLYVTSADFHFISALLGKLVLFIGKKWVCFHLHNACPT